MFIVHLKPFYLSVKESFITRRISIFIVKSFGSCFECEFKAYFTLGVKAKVEFKSNIPIGAITKL
jgi:hypothetical protein